jgi:sugar (pentulose or hexulose) kinase
MMLPWFEPEITPAVRTPFARTFGLDLSNAAAHVRAVVEGQMLAMATHAGWMGGTIARIHATGGASASRGILQVMADVFGAEVLQLDARNSACLGAALRAYHADRAASGETVPWDEVVAGFAEPARGSRVAPVAAHVRIYEDMKTLYAQRETEALGRA